jgi:hypothetical protein
MALLQYSVTLGILAVLFVASFLQGLKYNIAGKGEVQEEAE